MPHLERTAVRATLRFTGRNEKHSSVIRMQCMLVGLKLYVWQVQDSIHRHGAG